MDFILVILKIIVIAAIFSMVVEHGPHRRKEVAKAIITIQIIAIFICVVANSILYTQHGAIIDYTINTLCLLAAIGVYSCWIVICKRRKRKK